VKRAYNEYYKSLYNFNYKKSSNTIPINHYYGPKEPEVLSEETEILIKRARKHRTKADYVKIKNYYGMYNGYVVINFAAPGGIPEGWEETIADIRFGCRSDETGILIYKLKKK